MKIKQDRRIQYTKMVLRESLLDLLKTKSLSEVSVSELCKTADVNRNTFYNHYRFPKEIITELEEEVFNELANAVKDKYNFDEVILIACKQLERDKKVSELIFIKVEESNVLGKIIESFRNKPFQDQPKATQNPYKNFVDEFNEKGIVGVLRYWILNGFNEPAETVATFISKYMKKLNG